MFVPCPHCQFLVAHHPQLRPLPADCPRCGRPLLEDELSDAAGTVPAQALTSTDSSDLHRRESSPLAAVPGEAMPAGAASAGTPPGEAVAAGSDRHAPADDTQADTAGVHDAVADAAARHDDSSLAAPHGHDGSGIDPHAGIAAETARPARVADTIAVSLIDAPSATSASPLSTGADDATGARIDDAPPTQAVDTGAAGTTATTATRPARVRAWRPRDPARWRWPFIAALGVLLVLQIVLADRQRLAADPGWRPAMEGLCGVLRCSLPPWREPAAFNMLDRKVRPGPQPGTLRVDATFRNDARWSQPWPALQLALNDADGHALGSRVFAPQDYLGQPPDALLAPGQSAQITFLVQEPAPGTVAFSFRFR